MTQFQVVRGLENQILSKNPTDGYVWFATDTKKIYYSNGTDFISMGGNSSVFYGNMVLTETPDEGQTEFNFLITEIEGNEDEIVNTPNTNDLILNIPDGCFYRVLYTFEENDSIYLKTTKLTIAGSGSGGGGGGETSQGSVTISRIGDSNVQALYRNDCLIKFKVTAIDSSGEPTGNGVGTLFVNGVKKKENMVIQQGDNEVNVGEFLTVGNNNIRIEVSMNTGGTTNTTVSKTWTATAVNVALTWDYDETIINRGNNFTFSFSAIGSVEKTGHIIIDDYLNLTTHTFTSTAQQNYVLQDRVNYGLTHGAHTVEMYITANINGQQIRTESVYHNIIFADENNEETIISCKLINKNLTQYNTVELPIVIYDEKNTAGTATVILYENDIIKDTWTNCENSKVYTWNYTPIVAGDQILSISCGTAKINLFINVTALDINNEEVGNYAFKFKASDFSSNASIQNWNSNGVTATFSDKFDWINGGLKTELDERGNPRQFVNIKAGSTMTLNYQLFNNNAMNTGKCIKVIFKATNCRNYDAQVIKCFNTTVGGIDIKAQNALFKSTASSVTVPYCEDTYLELTFDVTKMTEKIVDGKDVSERYIETWLDGVPCGITVYDKNDNFKQNEYITIGSPDCDVQLYLFKVYEQHLKDEDHLANFIADASNAQEMLARFRRNDILDDNGEISYLKLTTANPDCPVHLYEIDRMTTTKKDKIADCKYLQYKGGDTPILTASGVEIKVQGTSSAAYGLAAFNIDSNFKNGFENAKGEHLDKWAMDDDAIPVDYFNTKVNVASCEGANNALNQEWYNRFQPYVCDYRQKNPKARDTMQFKPGVMFVLDKNQTTTANNTQDNVFKDTPGYVLNPFYKMYSVCNMGNSKKNIEVFHDQDNLLECCIEITDNQQPQQWMTTDQFTDEDMSDNYFEFRYPDGNENATQDMRDAWHRLVSWMAHCNPRPRFGLASVTGKLTQAEFDKYKNGYVDENNNHIPPIQLYYIDTDTIHKEIDYYDADMIYYKETESIYGYTDEPLDTPVTFAPYTFKDTKYTKVLKGLQITKYAGTYTTDCYEYRMAKMLSECEDYLIMDSLVFHFLFIERHTLIDNVAKNTFWSTEDGIHWNMVKDYDNDTADGNDNQGKLTLTYGIEPFDELGDKFAFNAHQAVWLNFIGGLKDACKRMYQELDSKGAWDATTYLNEFTAWQDCIPERCWIEDYYRKYIRPRKIYSDSMFLSMLEGGKKTHQRKQYETYQNYYISSKYEGKECKNSSIIIRGNGDGNLGKIIPATVYADCYIQAAFGSGDNPNVTIRVKRDEPISIPCPIDNLNNATIYFYLPQLYQTIGDISWLLPEQCTLSQAKRLREITIGTDSYPNTNLADIAFDGNTMLEKLIIRSCQMKNNGMSLDLHNAPSLKFLDATNSNFTSVTIADGAPIEEIHIQNPTTLVLSNLTDLQTLEIKDYSRLTDLNINNIDNSLVNSKVLVDNAEALYRYKLLNVQWTIDELNNLNIPVFDKLLTLNTFDDLTYAQSLTGKAIIPQDVYNGTQSMDIYNNYITEDKFNNIDLIFNGSNAVLYNVTIQNGDGSTYWYKKINKDDNIDNIFLSNGPVGTFTIDGIYKSDTVANTYEFDNKWNVEAEDGTQLAIIDKTYPYYNNVNQNIVIKPKFIEKTQKYTITIKNGEETIGEALIDYNTPFNEAIDLALNGNVPYKDDSNLPIDETYKIIGYALTADRANNKDIILNTNRLTIVRDATYYVAFDQVSVYDNILDEKYLTFNSSNQIGVKTGVILKGKITLPLQIDGNVVKGIVDHGFEEQEQITHIFIAKGDSQYTTIGFQAFLRALKLKYVELPKGITKISNQAFMKTIVEQLIFPGSVTTFGTYIVNFVSTIKQVQFGGPNDPSQLSPSENLKLVFINQDSNQSTYENGLIIYMTDKTSAIENDKWDELINKLDLPAGINIERRGAFD